MANKNLHVLKNVKRPNLFRRIFPESQFPRIITGGKTYSPISGYKRFVTDTTFRDGQQSLPPFRPQHIAQLFSLMHKLDNGTGFIRQSEFFVYTKRDRLAVEKCLALGYRFPEIIGWIRATESDLQLVKDLGLKETGILTSISDYQVFLKLGWSRKQAFDHYVGIVRKTLEAGIIPFCNLEDTTRADLFGFVIPFIAELMKLSEEYKMPVKVRICDTLGLGVDTPGAILPRSVQGLIHTIINETGISPNLLEWHGHNDLYRGLTNAATAWQHGCAAVNGTWLGIGERTGNTPVEALIFEHLSYNPSNAKMLDTTIITEIASFMHQVMNVPVFEKTPYIGSGFNVTKAGIHADGMLKHQEIYNPFDTELLLNRPPLVSITDKSGTAGIAFWINSNFKLSGKKKLTKNHPGVIKIKKAVDKYYEDGRISAISPSEMTNLVKLHIPNLCISL